MARDRGNRSEELETLLDRHVEDLGDGLALVVNFKRLAVVASPTADLARHVDIRQEVHLNLDCSVARTRFAAPALNVEREPTGHIAPDFRLFGGSEQLPDVIEHARVRGRVRSGRSADWTLINVHHFVHEISASDFAMTPGNCPRQMEVSG